MESKNIIDNLFGPDMDQDTMNDNDVSFIEEKAAIIRASEFFQLNPGAFELLDIPTSVVVRKSTYRAIDVFHSKKMTLTAQDIIEESQFG